MEPCSDELLARLAAGGSLDSYEALLARHRDRVYRVAYRMAGNAEDAEDWALASLVRVYRQLGHYDPASRFVPWLLKVATTTCMRCARQRARRRLAIRLEPPPDLVGPRPTEGATRLDADGDAAEAQRIRTAVGRLAPELQQALTLSVLEGLSFRELAAAAGIPVMEAASRVRRGLMRVRAQLSRRAAGVQR
jgi:RNA polymerase sigma-70 factor, ECF subfamily